MLTSVILIGLGMFAICSARIGGPGRAPLSTVGQVDVERYAGLWYEIAKIPNRFQRTCATGTTAFYSLRKDGRIDVLNRCIKKNGTQITAKGIARVVDTRSNARLKVSFVRFLGISLFWGDYWIIGLGSEYEYAIVGTPSRKYGWVLSRTPTLQPEQLEHIFSQLRDNGYDPDQFEVTVQDSSS